MKLFYICFLLILTPFTAIAQFTTVPDANFELALISKGYDVILDGQVLTANIDTVTFLDINNGFISDLTGIQGFTNLTQLWCFGNQLTSLNLNQNPALSELWVWDNLLTSLDITQNTVLSSLVCHNNQLTNLDVTQNSTLLVLICDNNQLTSLDVTQNPALLTLAFINNQLTSINLTQNIALSILHSTSN
jgi:hypothetical protein